MRRLDIFSYTLPSRLVDAAGHHPLARPASAGNPRALDRELTRTERFEFFVPQQAGEGAIYLVDDRRHTVSIWRIAVDRRYPIRKGREGVHQLLLFLHMNI
jgi:hypothetical protein